MQLPHGSALAGGPEAADPFGRQLAARGPYLVPDIKAGLFMSELNQHTHSTGPTAIGPTGAGGGCWPRGKPLPKEPPPLVRLGEILCPKLIIIMNLHFFPQENN